MAKRIYIGNLKEAIFSDLDGREVLVERGDAVNVSQATADGLDADPANWASPPSPRKKQDPNDSYDEVK